MLKRRLHLIFKREESDQQVSFKFLLLLAIGLHLTMTMSVYFAGRFSLFPHILSPNGSIADDSYIYHREAVQLVRILKQDGIAAWVNAAPQFHVKLYSLSFALFGPWLGFNTLSFEFLNLLFYLAILGLVFKVGQEVFDQRVGLLAAGTVALWPSFLLLTTQPLRDPLFITAMLTLILINVRWLTRAHAWHRGLLFSAIGAVASIILWLVRRQSWEVALIMVFIGSVLLVIRLIRERQILSGNLIGVLLLFLVIFFLPRIFPVAQRPAPVQARPSDSISVAESNTTPDSSQQMMPPPERPASVWGYLPYRIAALRYKFIRGYPDNSSNMDTNVQFTSMGDIIRYLPRAATIGFFAPFPNMWFTGTDSSSRIRRILSGYETSMMYVFEMLGLFALWQGRRRLPIWFLCLTALVGVMALGLVVVNIGTLYRMRYVFWMLLIVLGMKGAVQLFSIWSAKVKSKLDEPLSSAQSVSAN